MLSSFLFHGQGSTSAPDEPTRDRTRGCELDSASSVKTPVPTRDRMRGCELDSASVKTPVHVPTQVTFFRFRFCVVALLYLFVQGTNSTPVDEPTRDRMRECSVKSSEVVVMRSKFL